MDGSIQYAETIDLGPYAKKGAPSIKELLPKDSEELPKGINKANALTKLPLLSL